MPNQIDDPALTYEAGKEFDYSVWEPGTRIDLCNVPWDSQYRVINIFGDDDATPAERRALLNAYIDGLETPSSVHRGGSPVKVDVPVRVGLSHNLASRYNYVRARNPILPTHANPFGDIQRDYYYFILGTRYINPGTTELTLQLDVVQTFYYDVTFGQSYIERGHIGIANEDNFDGWGAEYLTVPEGIDIGSEYRIVTTKKERIDDQQTVPYNVLIAMTADLHASGGSVDNPSDPPRLVTSSGASIQGLPSGARYYVMEGNIGGGGPLIDFMNAWKEKPWITQSIISITAIPPIRRYLPGFVTIPANAAYPNEAPRTMPTSLSHSLFPNWRESDDLKNAIPARYRHLRKFFTFPYMAIEMTTYTGTPVILKPENWNSRDAHVGERVSIVPPGQRIVFWPRWYNTTGFDNTPVEQDDPGEYYDLTTQINNFPSFAIVNNSFAGYLASNQASMNAQYAGADWSQNRALRGAQVGYDNAMVGVNAQRQMTEANNQFAGATLGVQQQLARDNQFLGALGGTAMAGAGGLAAGPVGGAVSALGGVGSGLLGALTLNNTLDAARQQLGHQTNQAWRASDINTGASQMIADANKGLAEWGARGDYEQAIASLDARTQDARLMQPSTSGQMGGDMLHLIYGGWQLNARWKMLYPAAMAVIGEYWLQFGYAVHRVTVPPASLQVMSKFTYWKMTNVTLLRAPIPEGMRNALRGIFEKGTTVFTNPNDIGVTDYGDNQAKTGITL